jgi:hypothetical protein
VINSFVSTVDTLRDGQVKNYFLEVLRSDLSSEEKYERFVSYFEVLRQLKEGVSSRAPEADFNDPNKLARAASEVAQEAGLWKPVEILEGTRGSLERAVHRIANCQHGDGGWGYQVEQSNVWGTAYGILALKLASTALDAPFAWDQQIGRAIDWIKDHYREWCVGRVPPHGQKSVYEASVATRCLCRVGEAGFFAASKSLAELAKHQNRDGGWDAHIWGEQWPHLTGVWSEVGATSLALQSLTEANEEGFRSHIEGALHWLIARQNSDGSWNDGSCTPNNPALRGEPRITKTCDALKGILAALAFGIPNEFQTKIDDAMNWIIGREKLLNTKSGSAATGWGYDEGKPELFRPDLESTCLALETLVRLGDVALPFVKANASWLIDAQHREPGSIEDGKWVYGDSFRITLALLEYYTLIKSSALFALTSRAS